MAGRVVQGLPFTLLGGHLGFEFGAEEKREFRKAALSYLQEATLDAEGLMQSCKYVLHGVGLQ